VKISVGVAAESYDNIVWDFGRVARTKTTMRFIHKSSIATAACAA